MPERINAHTSVTSLPSSSRPGVERPPEPAGETGGHTRGTAFADIRLTGANLGPSFHHKQREPASKPPLGCSEAFPEWLPRNTPSSRIKAPGTIGPTCAGRTMLGCPAGADRFRKAIPGTAPAP
ncbi:hypothetical protein GCM10009660_59170 [Catellatospora bangladeshensis]